ncbi:EAL and GGDEF domain-containing protein [Caldimonas tepidiphila]|uniref:sensor domain-containing protein n=1 Tax=Caldimonas tepidiphila TaxID=2315841 RepID=UPI000E5BF8C8|nr:EAL domain-containing protein [Caldimonas tepidiphila]
MTLPDPLPILDPPPVMPTGEGGGAVPCSPGLSEWMFESSPDCVKVLDLDGSLLAMNGNGQCAMEIDDFGRWRGRAWTSFWPQDGRPLMEAALEAARQGRVGHFDAFCPTAKGSPRWWDVKVTPILGSGGRVERLLSVSRDVTALQRSREELRETASRLQFTLEAAEIGDWDLNLQGRTMRCSLRCGRCFGYAEPVEDWSCETFFEHVHPEDRADVRATIEEALCRHHDWRFQCRVVWPDGSVHWISAHGSVYRSAGKVERMLGIVVDITAQKRGEALALGQKKVLELAISGAPLPVLLDALARVAEERSGGLVKASILLLDEDGRHLRHGAAPSLPEGYNAAIDGVAIGPRVGSCGTAAHLGRPVIVRDIANDPLWADFRDLALAHGLRACWSQPILSFEGRVLGTLASYCGEVREPTVRERESMAMLVNTAALVLDQRREAEERRAAESALRASEERFRTLVSATSAIVWTASTAGCFDEPQPTWTAFTGQPFEALQGRGWLDAVHPDDRGTTTAMWLHATRGGVLPQFEHRLRRADGSYRHMSVRAVPLAGPDGAVREWAGIHTDITERKQAELHLRHLATHDTLTGLPNRNYLNEHLQELLRFAPRDGRIAVMLIDLDRFKQLNDSMGHEAGDALLCEVARRFKSVLRAGDVVARRGGDEFVVVAHCADGRESAERIAARLLQALAPPVSIGGAEVFPSASIGIAMSPEHGGTREELFQHADIAMYRSKAAGRNCHHFFLPEMSVVAKRRMTLELELRAALENEEFELHYQPRLRVGTLRSVGMEALVRWRHPERGLVSPLEFIPVAEETGMIEALGLWVLRRACIDTRRLVVRLGRPLRVSVNLSGRQLRSPQLVPEVRQILEQTGLDPGLLELELTESAFIEDMESSAETLRALKALGVQLAVDDFGTGYSSISYLRRFPVDVVKLDRTFVTQASEGVSRYGFIKAICDLARALNLTVVAEGVEDADTLDLLKRVACDEVQGYLFARPLPLEDVTDYLEQAAPGPALRPPRLPVS